MRIKNEFIKKFSSTINIINKKSIVPTLFLIYLSILIIFSLLNPLYISLANFRSIFSNIGIIGIIAFGLSFVMITGNVDISVGSNVGITTIVCAQLLSFKMPVYSVIIIAIFTGIIIGMLNGFLVTVVGINSIIATLGTLSILRGIAYIYGMKGIVISDKQFLFIGRGFLFGNVPLVAVYMIIILILMYIVLRFTKFGSHIYSIGGSVYVAELYGIKVKKFQFITFVICGITASISGILLASQMAYGRATYGTGYEFKALTACVLGGIALSGGRGSLVGVIIATFILGSISSGLAMVGIYTTWQETFQGIILISAIIFDSIRISKKVIT